MLWSPSEVLAYLKDDESVPNAKADPKQGNKLIPTAAFGGFQTWPNSKEDFILIAENSEIHGPNPLFTIPELDPAVDLNALATQILSADYQGLSNNKILPGRNAQLLMPDLAVDTHAAITYFFLFDSEARGFVRPTCLAYFTADKHKLMRLAEPILKTLGEASEILQHTNITQHTVELRALRDSIKETSAFDKKASISKGIFIEARLKDIQDVLDIAENYEGNDLFDRQLKKIMDCLKENAVYNILRKLDSTTFSSFKQKSPTKNPTHNNTISKKCLKNLHHICYNGVVLGLYHLYIMYKHFRRKYENIAVAEMFTHLKGDTLYFGACIKSSIQSCPSINASQAACTLHTYRIRSTLSLGSACYFECLDGTFEELLLSLLECEKNETDQNNLLKPSSCELTDSSEMNNSSSNTTRELNNEPTIRDGDCYHINCQHIGDLASLWDILEHIKAENPGIEESFLDVLKLFGDTRRLLFSVLTRVPLIVISTPKQLHTAQMFLKALSIFIPRRKDEILFVDLNRQNPLKKEHFTNFAAVNFCLSDSAFEDMLPVEYFQSMCILNLKDCSVTAPTYTGHLLGKIEDSIKALPAKGSVFSILINIYSEIERTIHWWHMLTSSSADMSTTTVHVLSKGFNHLDMQIIEALSKLCKS